MTTGEKLAKLRKESNLTQEELAEKLFVTRQAVSKWEQDLAFPETEKLVQISKLYNCSVDYLLGNSDISSNGKKSNLQSIYESKTFFTSIWSVVYFLIMLIVFFMPYVRVGGNLMGTFFYVDAHVYNLLFSGNIEFGNVLIIIAFLLLISEVVIGVSISYVDNKNKLYHWRKIASIIETSIWLICLLLFISGFQIGMLFVFGVSLTNLIGLVRNEKNKVNYLNQ
jgi:transcriptional regulator with XRE-family HTH domain